MTLVQIHGGVDTSRFKYREHYKTCLHCGMDYIALHARGKFCSPVCGRQYRFAHFPPEKKAAIVAGIRNRLSAVAMSDEQVRAKYTRANKAKSDRIKIVKYGTLDPKKIASIKKVSGFIKNRATMAARRQAPEIKLKSALYRRMNALIRGEAKKSHLEEYLGCSFNDFRLYIESQFQPGMSWSNHSRYGWHIDHIRPCAVFDFSMESQRKECFHFTNLRPLWAVDNLRKSDKILSATGDEE